MKTILLLTLPVLMLAGCNDRSGGEYLGKWTRQIINRHQTLTQGERVDTIQDTLTVERNGEGFMLRSARVFTQGKEQPTAYPARNVPALLKDGQLQVSGGLGAYVIDKSSGRLTAPDGEGDYIRAK